MKMYKANFRKMVDENTKPGKKDDGKIAKSDAKHEVDKKSSDEPSEAEAKEGETSVKKDRGGEAHWVASRINDSVDRRS